MVSVGTSQTRPTRNLSTLLQQHTYSQQEVNKMSIADWADAFQKETIDVAKMVIFYIYVK